MQQILFEHSGIVLADEKQNMVYNRLVRRVRFLKLKDFSSYFKLFEDEKWAVQEFDNFINSLTTNLTAFFRESHHFDFLSDYLKQKKTEIDKNNLKIWSAGCSVGEEPISIAITIYESLGETLAQKAKILATDIDTKVLSEAREAIYPIERIKRLDKKQLKRWFLRGENDLVKAKTELLKLISYLPLNLMDKWPMKGKFDVIFCRNVMIYFDKKTQHQLVNRMADYLNDNGILIIGHSESLYSISDRFKTIGTTIYQKIGN